MFQHRTYIIQILDPAGFWANTGPDLDSRQRAERIANNMTVGYKVRLVELRSGKRTVLWVKGPTGKADGE